MALIDNLRKHVVRFTFDRRNRAVLTGNSGSASVLRSGLGDAWNCL